MFGYATDETEECMPLTAVLSHKLNSRLAALRRSGEISWARPDSKTQVRRGISVPYILALDFNFAVFGNDKFAKLELCESLHLTLGR